MKLDEMLASRRVPFERLSHRPAYTANRVAQILHVSGKDVAKCVVLRTRRGYVLAVLPAPYRIDLETLGRQLNDDDVQIASEEEIQQLFPDCEVGAMPPFGSLYHLPTFIDDSLAEDDRIVFEAQNHEEAIRMSYRDYETVEHPVHGRFARMW
jgi:Ala-tRNA(Pro) deacylase